MKRFFLTVICILFVFAALGCAAVSAPDAPAPAANAPSAAPAATPEPTATPITDVLFDDGTFSIRYTGHSYYRNISVHLFSFYNGSEQDVMVFPGALTLGKDVKYSMDAAIGEKPVKAILGSDGYQKAPAKAVTNLMLLLFDPARDNALITDAEPDKLTVRISATDMPEDLTLVESMLDTGDIVIDAARYASTQKLEEARRTLAAANDGYAGVMFSTRDLDGAAVDDSLLGSAPLTVLHFFAAWSEDAESALSAVAKAANACSGDGVNFLAVQVDSDRAAAKALWEKLSLSFAGVFATDDLYQMYLSLDSVPVTVILDSHGRQLGAAQHGVLTEEALVSLIESARGAWTKTYAFDERDVTMTYCGGDTLVFTMTDPDLAPAYTINRSETETGGVEFSWYVAFTDGKTAWTVGTDAVRQADADEILTPFPRKMVSGLYPADAAHTASAGKVSAQALGKRIQWVVSVPKGFDFEAAEATDAGFVAFVEP